MTRISNTVKNRIFPIAVSLLLLFACISSHAAVHSADTSENGRISLGELLRVVQLFNSEGYSCSAETEDGYRPGNTGTTDCATHDSDYITRNWNIELSELLRCIQFFNAGRYITSQNNSEDGYDTVTGNELDPHMIPVAGDTDGNFLTEEEEEALGLSDDDTGTIPIGIRLAQAAFAALSDISTPSTYVYINYRVEPTPFSSDLSDIHFSEITSFAGSPPLPNDRLFIFDNQTACLGCQDPFTLEVLKDSQFYFVVDPIEKRMFFIPEFAWHFLRYGSFSYMTSKYDTAQEDLCRFDGEQKRIDVAALLDILGIDPHAV